MTAALIHGQMVKVAAALSHIPKQRSSGVSYEFRSVDAVMNALHGPLAEHGVFYVPRVLDDWQVNMIPGKDNRMQAQALFRVEVEFFAEDGSSVVARGLAQSHDYGDKAVYQATQNAIKYLLLQAFCIPVDEADMDGRQPDSVPQRKQSAPFEEPSDEQMAELTDVLGQFTDERRAQLVSWVLSNAGVEALGDLDARAVRNATAALRDALAKEAA